MPTWASLVIIFGVLTVAILASLRADKRDRDAGILPPDDLPVTDAADASEPGGVDPERPPSGRSREH
jgi:hypothetical protein